MKKLFIIAVSILTAHTIVVIIDQFYKGEPYLEEIKVTRDPCDMFAITSEGSGYIEMQRTQKEHNLFTVTIGDDIVNVDLNAGKPIAEKPFVVKMIGKTMIIYKKGKKIGAFMMIEKPFELDGLQAM